MGSSDAAATGKAEAMTLEVYAAYLATVVLLVMVPGPVVGLVIALAGARGARPALVASAGASLSIALQLLAAALGLASLMALLGDLFAVLRYVCAAYLVYMAVLLWRAPVKASGPAAPLSGTGAFVQGFLVSSTNPKSLVFFAALFPQFIEVGEPALGQLLVLTLTFQAVFSAGVAAYALAAARMRRALTSPRAARWRNRLLATLLGGTAVGLIASTLRR